MAKKWLDSIEKQKRSNVCDRQTESTTKNNRLLGQSRRSTLILVFFREQCVKNIICLFKTENVVICLIIIGTFLHLLPQMGPTFINDCVSLVAIHYQPTGQMTYSLVGHCYMHDPFLVTGCLDYLQNKHKCVTSETVLCTQQQHNAQKCNKTV